MVGEAGQEAVQVAVTWVAANLTALQQWLGTAAEGAASGRPLLWRPGQEELYVSVSEVRAGTEGRCVLQRLHEGLRAAVCRVVTALFL